MDVSQDAFLGGALEILQPKGGYRAGLDAVLLAAAAPLERSSQPRVLDAGAGVGVVGLCVARRVAGAHVTLVEIEPELAALAHENVSRNGLDARVRVVQVDVANGGAAFNGPASSESGLVPGAFTHVLANPPYLESGRGTVPQDRLKAAAHQMPRGGLDAWIRFLATAAAADGSATVIYPAEQLAALLAQMEGRFGALKVFPIFPRRHSAATRVIVQGIKASRAPLQVLPGLVLHDEGNAFRPELQAILRQGAPLSLAP
ncbi:MAG: tRNA1(Val) (adenine(37)-N6)-methyltransferase [Bacteroidota bacterium]